VKCVMAFGSLLFLLTFPLRSHACSLAGCLGDGGEMGRDFVVLVKHQGRPLPGVSVWVTKFPGDDSKLFPSTTGTDGTVRITHVLRGEYWLHTELLGIGAGGGCFHVRSHPSRNAKLIVRYEWGDLAPATSQIAGRIVDPQPGEGAALLQNIRNGIVTPIPEVRLKLQNALSGETYNNLSNGNGDFSFAPIPNGIYVLHVDSGKAPSGRDYESADLLIRLSDSATANTLLLKRTSGGAGSCGGPTLALELGRTLH
jgi:hypothetical protein